MSNRSKRQAAWGVGDDGLPILRFLINGQRAEAGPYGPRVHALAYPELADEQDAYIMATMYSERSTKQIARRVAFDLERFTALGSIPLLSKPSAGMGIAPVRCAIGRAFPYLAVRFLRDGWLVDVCDAGVKRTIVVEGYGWLDQGWEDVAPPIRFLHLMLRGFTDRPEEVAAIRLMCNLSDMPDQDVVDRRIAQDRPLWEELGRVPFPDGSVTQ